MKAADELAKHVGVKPACAALEVSRSTLYRRRGPSTGQQQPRPTPARALSETERGEVFDTLCSERFVDRSPAEVVATLLDEEVYLCSERTMYRVLASEVPVQERRAQRTHPEYKKPELMATAPNQVWSWDITQLLGPKKWSYYYLYVIMDIYSRYVVGWMVADRENSALGGCAAIEESAKKAGHDVQVPFSPGRTDALQEQTDVDSFAVLEPTADGFRNYVRNGHKRPAEELVVDRAHTLTLTAPEMTVLVGGMRVLNANVGQSELGVFTNRPETLTNDFFVNLLDMNTKWQVSSKSEHVFEGRNRGTDELKCTGTAVDLVFGSNSQLRAIVEVYACDDSQQTFVRDFVAAWDKVMNLDRFDLDPSLRNGS